MYTCILKGGVLYFSLAVCYSLIYFLIVGWLKDHLLRSDKNIYVFSCKKYKYVLQSSLKYSVNDKVQYHMCTSIYYTCHYILEY